jgi:methionine sulfoxide reductase heme-binding subunit
LDAKGRITAFAGAASLALFAVFSSIVRDTETVWLLTRSLGLLSYLFLFVSIALGELRLLTKGRSEFAIFSFHKPASIFAVFLVAAHFIAAFADDYKWGKQLTFVQYLGFSFSDKWLAYLSLGVLAFYLMLLVSLTCSGRPMRSLGFRGWKLVHYLSYAAYAMAYVHAVTLGTDIKTSALSPVLHPLIVLSFAVVCGLLAARILSGLGAFSDQLEASMAAILFVLLISSAAALSAGYSRGSERMAALQNSITIAKDAGDLEEANIVALINETAALKQQLREGIGYGKNG